MGRLLRVLSLYLVLGLSVLLNLSSSSDNIGTCRSLVSCMKCDGSNATQCTKCSQLLLRRRHCDDTSCPPGYHSRWTSLSDFMSTVCQERLGGGGGVSGEVVGAGVGLVLCLTTALVLALYCRLTRRRKINKHPPSLSHSTQSQYFSSDESERETLEFLREIRRLRGDAPVFLEMLNETRRQVRSLPSLSAHQPYRPVLKDLSRILILLNRAEGALNQPPPDWETLLAWAHRILARYKKRHLSSSNQVNELVSFFHGEANQYGLSTFDSNYNTNTRKTESSDCGGDYVEWQSCVHSQLDDFVSLGFRPQDEITTEL